MQTCTRNLAAISNKLTQKTSVWKAKKLGITRQVQEGAGVEEKQATSSLCPGPNREVHRTRTGFTRLPVLDRPDYFGHDRGRGKYTERVCSTERREEGGGGRRGACRERTRGVWVPFFERGLLHRARGSTVTQTEPSGLATCCKTRGKDQDAMHTI